MKESLVTRDPFKVTVGDDVRTFTKTKVRESFFLNPWLGLVMRVHTVSFCEFIYHLLSI